MPFAPTRVRRVLAIAAAAAASLLGTGSADAALVTLNGFAAGSENVRITLAAAGGHAALDEDGGAGGLAATIGGQSSFVTYCVDLYQDVGFGQTYGDFTPVPSRLHAFANPNAALDIGKLYFADGATLATGTAQEQAIHQAAYQFAIWEIAYELSGHYDVFSGNLTLAPSRNNTPDTGAALAQANQWLAALPGVQRAYDLVVLESPSYQDQVYATTLIREPPAAALMASALLAVGWTARRRTRPRR